MPASAPAVASLPLAVSVILGPVIARTQIASCHQVVHIDARLVTLRSLRHKNIWACSFTSRFRALRAPLRDLDVISARPRNGNCRSEPKSDQPTIRYDRDTVKSDAVRVPRQTVERACGNSRRTGRVARGGVCMTDLGELMTVHEVAALLKVSRSWVYEHSRSRGKPRSDRLPHIKIGKYVRFDPHVVRAFLDRQTAR